jgi:hypothetical protein
MVRAITVMIRALVNFVSRSLSLSTGKAILVHHFCSKPIATNVLREIHDDPEIPGKFFINVIF